MDVAPNDDTQIDQQEFSDIGDKPLNYRLEWCQKGKGDEAYIRMAKVLHSLHNTSLQDIGRADWDKNLIVDSWEYFDSMNYADIELSPAFVLLGINDIHGKLKEYLTKKGLEIIDSPLKIYLHLPNATSTGYRKVVPNILVCDDYLPNLLDTAGKVLPLGQVFEEFEHGKLKIDLSKYEPILPDESHPRGRLARISITDKILAVVTDHPILSSDTSSTGIIMPNAIYASKRENPLTLAWTGESDYNIGKAISHFRRYLKTGEY